MLLRKMLTVATIGTFVLPRHNARNGKLESGTTVFAQCSKVNSRFSKPGEIRLKDQALKIAICTISFVNLRSISYFHSSIVATLN